MSKIVRIVMMSLSTVLLFLIGFFVIYNRVHELDATNMTVYIIKIIFGLAIGIYILIFSYLGKKAFQNIERDQYKKLLVMLLGFILIFVYSTGIVLYIYETFIVFAEDFSSFSGIVAAMLIVNVMAFSLQGNHREKNQKKEDTMYNAQITYKFKEGKLEEGIQIWKEGVYNKIIDAEGFIRVQLYAKDNEMMVIGTWEDKTYADNFMKTGVFKDVMGMFDGMLQERPVNQMLELIYFEAKK